MNRKQCGGPLPVSVICHPQMGHLHCAPTEPLPAEQHQEMESHMGHCQHPKYTHSLSQRAKTLGQGIS